MVTAWDSQAAAISALVGWFWTWRAHESLQVTAGCEVELGNVEAPNPKPFSPNQRAGSLTLRLKGEWGSELRYCHGEETEQAALPADKTRKSPNPQTFHPLKSKPQASNLKSQKTLNPKPQTLNFQLTRHPSAEAPCQTQVSGRALSSSYKTGAKKASGPPL